MIFTARHAERPTGLRAALARKQAQDNVYKLKIFQAKKVVLVTASIQMCAALNQQQQLGLSERKKCPVESGTDESESQGSFHDSDD